MSTSPITSQTGQDSTNTPVISPNFNAVDADVMFESSDHVRFYIHRKNLEAHAGVLPPAEYGTNGEIVSLTEDSSTLEHLFHYMYPQLHPSLDLLPSEDFFKLAEAAEKYKVFNVMSMCNMRMKQVLHQHPAEAFSYASNHDYPEIMNSAAPLLLDVPLDEIVTKLSLHLVVPWVRYWKSWCRAVDKAITSKNPDNDYSHDPTITTSVFDGGTFGQPYAGQPSYARPKSDTRYMRVGQDQPLSHNSLINFLKSSLLEGKYRNPSQYDALIAELDKALNEVPDFLTFI